MTVDLRKKIIFRVDGGNVWGVAFGHIKRSLLVADALRSHLDILFVMKEYVDGVALVKEKGFSVETIPVDDDTDETMIRLLHHLRPDKVFIDLVACPYTTFFQEAAKLNIKTVVFDIIGRCAGRPDVIINDSVVDSFTSHLFEKAAITMLGPEYFIMEKPAEITPLTESVRNVLITMGGADPAGLTVKIMTILLPAAAGLNITVVLGPTFSDDAAVDKIAQHSGNTLRIERNPPDFIGLTGAQDIVISAGGRTLYECAHLGRPTIIVPSIEHEAVTAEVFASRAGFLNIGLWNDALSPERLLQALKRYREDEHLRNQVHSKGRRLVDGNGLKRILDKLAEH